MNRFVRYAISTVVIISVLLTGYYYAYLGLFKADSSEKNVRIEETDVTNETVEPVSNISSVLKNEGSAFSVLASKFFIEKTRGVTYVSVSLKDTEKLNELIGKFAFDGTQKNETTLKVSHGKNGDFVKLNGKVNGRTLSLEGEYGPRGLFVDKAVLNGVFSMIDRGRLDFFLDELGGYVKYDSFNNSRLERFDSKFFDDKIGESKVDLVKAIAGGIGSVFVCDKRGTSCEFDINEGTMKKVTSVLLNANGLTTMQKSNISSMAKDILYHLDGTKIVLTETGYSLKSKNRRLIFDVQFSYEDDGSEYVAKNDVSKYERKTFEKIVSDFEKENSFFVSIMSNSKEIIPMLLNE